MWIVAGIFTALAGMSRSEGLLLTIAMGVAALAWSGRTRWYRRVGLLLAGYLPFIAYFWWENLRHFGAASPARVRGLSLHHQLRTDQFATHITDSVSALLGGGPGLRYSFPVRVLLLPGSSCGVRRQSHGRSLAYCCCWSAPASAGPGRRRPGASRVRTGAGHRVRRTGLGRRGRRPAGRSRREGAVASADDRRWYRRLITTAGCGPACGRSGCCRGLYAALMLLLDGELARLVQVRSRAEELPVAGRADSWWRAWSGWPGCVRRGG